MLQVLNRDKYITPKYQWFKDGYILVSDTLNYLIVSSAGNYMVDVSDQGCASSSMEITVSGGSGNNYPSVLINSSTGSMNLCASPSVLTLFVSNLNKFPNAICQWYTGNGEPIVGATGSQLLVHTVGSYFVRILTNGCEVTSALQTITLGTNDSPVTPVIDTVGGSATLCGNGSSLMLRVFNTDRYENPVYQWYKNGLTIVGATHAYLIITAEGNYKATVTDGVCEVVSEEIHVIKDNNITMPTIQLVSSTGIYTLCNRYSVLNLSVANANAYPNAKYVWYKDGEPIRDNDGATLLVTAAGDYFVHLSDGNCGATSATITIDENNANTVTPLPIVESASGNTELCGTGSSILLVLTNHTLYHHANYQWYKGKTLIKDATDAILPVTDSGDYFVAVTEDGCAVISNATHVSIGNHSDTTEDPVQLASNTGSYVLCSTGSSLTLSVVNASDYVGYNYKWFKDNVEMTGYTSSSIVITRSGIYRVHVYDDYCSVTSATVKISQDMEHFMAQPRLTSVSGSNILCDTNSALLLEVSNAKDYTSPVYHWFKDNVEVSVTTVPLYAATHAGDYTVMVIDRTCGYISNAITVINHVSGNVAKPLLSIEPTSAVLCGQGAVNVLTVSNVAQYSPMARYIWYADATAVAQGNEATYMAKKEGGYQVFVMDNGCSALSDSLHITLSSTMTIQTPKVICNQNITDLCVATSPVILSVSNASIYSDFATYVWYDHLTEVKRSTSTTYEVKAPGRYYVVVIDGDCASMSNDFTFVQNVPVFTQDPCIGCTDCNPSTREISCETIGTPIVLVNTERGTYLHTGNQWNITATSQALPLTYVYTLSGATTGSGNSLDGVEFNPGVTNVIWRVTNSYNETATCDYRVIVVENLPCIGCEDGDTTTTEISCASIGSQWVYADMGTNTYTKVGNSWDITAIAPAGIRSIAYSLSGATVVIYNDKHVSLYGQSFNIGTTRVTWHVVDNEGNTSTCDFDVTVWDNIPCIGCDDNNDSTVEISCNSIIAGGTTFCADEKGTYRHVGKDWDITVTDAHGIDTLYYVLSGATSGEGTTLDGVTFNTGITTVTWYVKNILNLSNNCSFEVTVNALPDIFIHTQQTYCHGDQVPLTVLGNMANTTYSWSVIDTSLWNLPLNGTSMIPAFTAKNNGNSRTTMRFLLKAVNQGVTYSCVAVDTLFVNVLPIPVADFTAQVTGLGEISFTNHSTGGVSYLWTFGDGDTSSFENPAHTFVADGIYQVTLSVTNVAGCVSSVTREVEVNRNVDWTVDFFINESPQCLSGNDFVFVNTSRMVSSGHEITGYAWDFGDGVTATTREVSHVYAAVGNYPVTLTVTESGGATSSITRWVKVIATPVIADTIAPAAVCSGEFLQVSIPDIAWNGNTPTTGEWLLDGKQFSPALTPVTNADSYKLLQYTVASACGLSAGTGSSITVHALPVADFTAQLTATGEVSFTDHSVSAVAWEWNFGDATYSNAQHPVHEYQQTATYNVTLTVFNAAGCAHSISKPVIVSLATDLQARFDINNESQCLSHNQFIFTNQSSLTTYNHLIKDYVWDFGDGTTDSVRDAVHTYSSYGIYDVTLTVTEFPGGTTSSVTRSVTVRDLPFIADTIAPAAVCSGEFLQVSIPDIAWNGNTPTNGEWLLDGTIFNPASRVLTQEDHGKRLQYQVNSPCGTGTGTGSSITVNVMPKFVQQPDQTYCEGTRVSTLTLGRDSRLIYDWRQITDISIGINEMEGSDTIPTFVATNLTPMSKTAAFEVTPRLRDGSCMATPYLFHITVTPRVRLSDPLSNDTLCSGDLFNYVANTIVPNVSYQWIQPAIPSINEGKPALGIGNMISERLLNGDTVPVKVSYIITLSHETCRYKDTLSVTVRPDMTIALDHLATLDACSSDSLFYITYTTPNTGVALEYMVLFDNKARVEGFENVYDYTPVTAAGVIMLPFPTGAREGQYTGTLFIKGYDCPSMTNYPFTITVHQSPIITAQPEGNSMLCEDTEPIVMEVTAVGYHLSYQWYKDGMPIAGAVFPRYENLEPATDDFGTYHVVVTSDCGSAISTPVVIEHNRAKIYRKWDDVLLVANKDSLDNNLRFVRYQWYKQDSKGNFIPVQTGGNAEYYRDPETLSGNYAVRVYYADGTSFMSCPFTVIPDKSSTKWQIWPNPINTKDVLNVLLEGEKSDAVHEIEILSLTGQTVVTFTMTGDRAEIPTRLIPGMYIVRLISAAGDNMLIQKLVVH
jgi:PKD repeat protein